MIQNLRKCIVQGHDYSFSSRICTFTDCNLPTRWVCAECIVEKKHDHGQQNQNHIMKQDQFQAFIKKQLSKCANNRKLPILQQCIVQLKQILLSTKQLIDLLEQQFKKIIQKDSNEITQLLTQATNDFLSIDKIQIHKLVNYDFSIKYDTKNSQDLLQSIMNSCQQITQIIGEKKQKKKNQQVDKNILQQKPTDYNEYLRVESDISIHAVSISPNQKYIAYGKENQMLEIIDLSTKKVVRKEKLEDNLTSCIYNSDSSLLFCGDAIGNLYCLDVTENFKTLFKVDLHSDSINDLKLMGDDNIITCSSDLSICITDFIEQVGLLEISDAHQKNINQIEYDEKNQTIISCSDEDTESVIKIFNLDGQLIISPKNTDIDGIYQIQLVNDNKLLSRSEYELILWQIDYKQNKLIQLKQLALEDEDIYFFYSVFNHTRILKIFPLYLQIIDFDSNILYEQQHHIEEFFVKFSLSQLGSLNIIVILGQNPSFKKTNSMKCKFSQLFQLFCQFFLISFDFSISILDSVQFIYQIYETAVDLIELSNKHSQLMNVEVVLKQ